MSSPRGRLEGASDATLIVLGAVGGGLDEGEAQVPAARRFGAALGERCGGCDGGGRDHQRDSDGGHFYGNLGTYQRSVVARDESWVTHTGK